VCKWSFQWKARQSGEKDDAEELTPLRLCMLVDAADVSKARTQLGKMFEGGQASTMMI